MILKKYSPIGELGEFAKQYVESLASTTGYVAVVCDRDSVIAVAGGSKRELNGKSITKDFESAMERRETYIAKNNSRDYCALIEGDDFEQQPVSPIIA